MDLRVERTKRAIANAFLQVRSRKQLEKITVKELADLAGINKATFYLHYADIYALSEELERQTIRTALASLPWEQADRETPGAFLRQLNEAVYAQSSLLGILFGGSRSGLLGARVEEEMQAALHRQFPAWQPSLQEEVLLSYTVYGSLQAFLRHPDKDPVAVLQIVSDYSCQLVEANPIWWTGPK